MNLLWQHSCSGRLVTYLQAVQRNNYPVSESKHLIATDTYIHKCLTEHSADSCGAGKMLHHQNNHLHSDSGLHSYTVPSLALN